MSDKMTSEELGKRLETWFRNWMYKDSLLDQQAFQQIKSILEDVKEDAVKDLGWANGWGDEPVIVKECKRLKHKTSESSDDPPFRRFNWTVRCDICGYVYRYDSSG